MTKLISALYRCCAVITSSLKLSLILSLLLLLFGLEYLNVEGASVRAAKSPVSLIKTQSFLVAKTFISLRNLMGLFRLAEFSPNILLARSEASLFLKRTH
jgi:hypothetical protein